MMLFGSPSIDDTPRAIRLAAGPAMSELGFALDHDLLLELATWTRLAQGRGSPSTGLATGKG
jgi:hypothetical protein